MSLGSNDQGMSAPQRSPLDPASPQEAYAALVFLAYAQPVAIMMLHARDAESFELNPNPSLTMRAENGTPQTQVHLRHT